MVGGACTALVFKKPEEYQVSEIGENDAQASKHGYLQIPHYSLHKI